MLDDEEPKASMAHVAPVERAGLAAILTDS